MRLMPLAQDVVHIATLVISITCLALFSYVLVLLRDKTRLRKSRAKFIESRRTRTLRLLINPQVSFDGKSLTTQHLRQALEVRFVTSIPESKTIFSIALDLPNRLCATITLNEVDNFAWAKGSFELDLGPHTNVKVPAHVTVDADFLGITTLYDGAVDNKAVDLLAVPGLGSHAFGSFKSIDSGENWLRDYLPVALPNIRVLLYGYDTSLVNSNAKESITDLARRLLISIRAHRRHGSSPERPIIFICHSLGGLLVKEVRRLSTCHFDISHALSIASESMPPGSENERLFRACYGLVFFGVPNNGLRNEQLRAMVHRQPSQKLVDDLVVDSDFEASPLLRALASRFSRCCAKQDFSILSFYERESSHTIAKASDGRWTKSGPKVLLVTEESATKIGLRNDAQSRVALRTDHAGLVKFKHRNDPNYIDVVQPEIERMVREAAGVVKSRFACRSTPLTNQERRYIQALTHVPLQEVRHRISEPCTGTIRWFLEVREFTVWRDSQETSALWISGPPGQGKSVLAKFIVQHLEDRQPIIDSALRENSHTVIYFFCFNQDPNYRHPSNILQALILQLLDHHEALDCLPTGLLTPDSFLNMSVASLWDLFLKLLDKYAPEPVYCVIDAIDECESDWQRNDILSRLTQLLSASRQIVKLLITSRDGEKDIERQLRHIPHYILKPHSEDLQLFIQSKVDDLESDEFGPSMKDEIISALSRRAGNTFLWVSAMTRQFADLNTPSLHEVRKILSGNPDSLDELYKRIILRLAEEKVFAKILTWVLYSVRPLRLEELEDAITYDPSLRPFAYLSAMAEFRIQITRSFIRKKLGTVLEVLEKVNWGNETADYVFFNHQSMQDFLYRHGDRLLNENKAEYGRPRAELLLARTCIAFLRARELCDIPTEKSQRHKQTKSLITSGPGESPRKVPQLTFNKTNQRDRIDDLARRYPLFTYACAYWYAHINRLEEAESEWESICHLLDRKQPLLTLWVVANSPYYLRNFQYDETGLLELNLCYLALQCDVPWLTNLILLGRFEHVIFSAKKVAEMARMAPNSFRLLCSFMKTSPVPIPKSGSTIPRAKLTVQQHFESLLLAVQSGHSTVVQALVTHNSCKGLHKDQEAVLLQIALELKYKDVLSVLLEQELDSAAPHPLGHTALHVAVCMQHLGVVKYLVENGANINACNKIGSTPLIGAAIEGSRELVDYLSKAGADANICNDQGYGALFYAVFAGYADIAETLLANGADPHLANRYGKNALHYAAEIGHADIVRILLEAKCNPNSLDDWTATPLHMAATRQNPEVVQALILGGADPLLLDGYGHTSLDWASTYEPCFNAMGEWANQYTATPSHVSRRHARKFLATWLRLHFDHIMNQSTSNTAFYLVGHLLLLLSDVPAAHIAFETGIRMVSGELVQAALCNGCRINHRIRGARYACRSCANTDFCISCFQTLRATFHSKIDQVDDADRSPRRDTSGIRAASEKSLSLAKRDDRIPYKDHMALERCKNHDFIEVPREEWTTFKPGCVDEQGTSFIEWASALYDRYRELEPTS